MLLEWRQCSSRLLPVILVVVGFVMLANCDSVSAEKGSLGQYVYLPCVWESRRTSVLSHCMIDYLNARGYRFKHMNCCNQTKHHCNDGKQYCFFNPYCSKQWGDDCNDFYKNMTHKKRPSKKTTRLPTSTDMSTTESTISKSKTKKSSSATTTKAPSTGTSSDSKSSSTGKPASASTKDIHKKRRTRKPKITTESPDPDIKQDDATNDDDEGADDGSRSGGVTQAPYRHRWKPPRFG